jgi:acetyl-CoA synthetase
VVKAFVVLTPSFSSRKRAQLTELLQAHVKTRLAPYEYPKEIEYVDALPMTTTGKIQRRVLRQLEIGRSQRQAKKLKAPSS